ncbi:YceI family protein [Lentibacillus cibarius]|uniref:YceI family protein n=1 Tax=Lentibacillus cibarius TaxID=2583219 RepID=A0A549YGC5_9BACI|nr:YceI family protein [Lentibacillus cibarius]TRM10942.1 YceI family protein [Lentibacillus cibarius]
MTKAIWNVDKVHSTIGFSVRHMMISNVKGTFNDFEGTVEADPQDLTDASVDIKIDANSIDTRRSDRDDHLRSADFFDVENHPNLTFKATNIEKKSEDHYDMTGDLTIRGTTNPVTFDITFEGMAKDPMSGDEAAGFTGSTTINRKDFGLTWNAALETGGVVVSDEVKINIEIQLRK